MRAGESLKARRSQGATRLQCGLQVLGVWHAVADDRALQSDHRRAPLQGCRHLCADSQEAVLVALRFCGHSYYGLLFGLPCAGRQQPRSAGIISSISSSYCSAPSSAPGHLQDCHRAVEQRCVLQGRQCVAARSRVRCQCGGWPARCGQHRWSCYCLIFCVPNFLEERLGHTQLFASQL